MSDDEETNDPLVADVRNFYKVEKWTKDGTKVDSRDHHSPDNPLRPDVDCDPARLLLSVGGPSNSHMWSCVTDTGGIACGGKGAVRKFCTELMDMIIAVQPKLERERVSLPEEKSPGGTRG